jgi:hypothetical protein
MIKEGYFSKEICEVFNFTYGKLYELEEATYHVIEQALTSEDMYMEDAVYVFNDVITEHLSKELDLFDRDEIEYYLGNQLKDPLMKGFVLYKQPENGLCEVESIHINI